MRDHLLDPHAELPTEPQAGGGAAEPVGVAAWIARRAARTGSRVAVRYEPGAQESARSAELTYADLDERARRLAHALRADGVGPGDRVAYLGPNRPGFLECLVATGLLGGVFVPLNTLLTASELDHQLADCGARILLRDALVPPPALAVQVPVRQVGNAVYEAVLAAAESTPLAVRVTPDDPCLILYTSGTTGRPKGAVLTHRAVLWNCLNVLVDVDLTGDEVALVAAPLFHAAALGMLALPVLLKGGTCVLVDSFDASHALDLVARLGVTATFAVPTMLQRIAALPEFEEADLSSLRTLLCGGAPVPSGLKERYAARGVVVREGYGLTEAAPGVLVEGCDGLVPHFFTDVRVAALAGSPEGTGELQVRGPNLMAGYWGRPEETGAAFDGGWLRTGDVVRARIDGVLQVVDRLKEVIISGGENIYPAEVELALAEVPGVAECAVVGVAHPDWGEVGHALLVAADGITLDPDTVLSCLDGGLARYKIPHTAEVVPSLPRTRTGKLHRAELRTRYGTPE
ncbi:AMP-binding protein [Actinocorallia sp. A-T 12471]|uniref:AMP-binding protein n=1 Tax=Actinocorallia sp. A-T 12471 TaxID=3089813 RepID=UPI0029D27EE2|nr:AMP-binding protein [Actinocorallia sp. A-T 12471]MDX6744128.1 AMP-binding protein [Actinocorallia sp. A-T 12471]